MRGVIEYYIQRSSIGNGTQVNTKFFNLEGDATGLLSIGGSLGKTNFNYEAAINHAVFDKIYLGSLKSKGNYNGSFLSVEYAESKDNWIKYPQVEMCHLI